MTKNHLFLIGGALALVAVAACSVLATVLIMNRQREVSLKDFQANYAVEGVTIIDDAEALSKAVQEMQENTVTIGMSYQYDSYSKNGRDFTCYIGNPKKNGHDMFITIYADSDHKDPLFTSKLLRPGSAFDHITFDRRLDPGTYDLDVGFTLVDTDKGTQKVLGSQLLSLCFHVYGEDTE